MGGGRRKVGFGPRGQTQPSAVIWRFKIRRLIFLRFVFGRFVAQSNFVHVFLKF